MAFKLAVRGHRDLIRAATLAGRETSTKVRAVERKVGEVVRVDAARRFERIDARSAAGYRTVVRTRGVSVEQRYRRTTGNRPDYGVLQMKEALEPAVDAKKDEVERGYEHAMNEIADIFDRRGA